MKKFILAGFLPFILTVLFLTWVYNNRSLFAEADSIPQHSIVKGAEHRIQTSNNCTHCHDGLEPIRSIDSEMMQEILKLAKESGNTGNDCIVCHGGNPNSDDKSLAHSGSIEYFLENKGPKEFYPNPSSIWINENTCGLCHDEQVRTQFTSLMFTEAGKIQGTTWGFGGIQGYQHNVANMATTELEAHDRLGSEVYKAYMNKLKEAEPQVFPGKMKGLPEAPTMEQLEEDPSLAVYTYLRAECQRCHTGVKGQFADGDFRGSGCASCHVPYSTKGLYEGDDQSISKTQKGKMLVHRIQSSRDVEVEVHGKKYTGVQTKSCTGCHNRGRRIGVSYEGLMETSYQSPFMSGMDNQSKIHKKNYIHLESDVHLQHGMLCQDCHTSGDLHSLGDLSGAIQGAVEIECQDCHGTTEKYPWELPIGYSDEITGKSPMKGEGRGLAKAIPDYLQKGWVAPENDGYLLTARGNPMPKVTRTGDSIMLYSASGRDLVLVPLKKLAEEQRLNTEARVAMVQVDEHMDKMECYACHASWAPQCYGCHIKIDYSKPERKLDWVSVLKKVRKDGTTLDEAYHEKGDEALANGNNVLIGGKVTEQRSFLRWEDPPLVVNGEDRISPAIPGCQTTVSVKDANGNVSLLNHIFKIPGVEGAGEEGQLAIDIAPLQPHTIQKKARSCESCHNNPKSMGYGIASGNLYSDPSKNYVNDLRDENGNPLAQNADTQFNAIPNLKMDWSRFLDEDGKQLQTVGHHFSKSRPLNKEELGKLDRRGVCLACHKEIPDGDMAIDLLSHVAKFGGLEIDNEMHSSLLHKSMLFTAWGQVLLGILLITAVVLLYYRRRSKKSA